MSELYKYIIKYPLMLGLSLFFMSMVNGQKISVRPNLTTGALSEIKITPDSTEMDWIMSTDGLQYKWIDEKYGWGLGFFDVSRNNVTTHHLNVKSEMLPDGKIDGAKGAFYDPFSNDQDWALVHYYTVNYDLN